MRLKKTLAIIAFLPIFIASNGVFASEFTSTPYEVCFTPGGQCTDDIVQEINEAKQSIYVQAYSFTSKPIATALIAAHARGINVEVILDKSMRKGRASLLPYLISNKIPTWIDYKVSIAHNKVMIIDNQTVITGSFNFTKAAQYKNAENLLIIHDSNLAKSYMQNWNNREVVSIKAY